jgi:polar amino acid transport system substrate-binding protein
VDTDIAILMRTTFWLAVVLLGGLIVRGNAQDRAPSPDVRNVLAPTGRLRVGLYLGNPSSLLKDPVSGQESGVGFELGRELAKLLDVPFEQVV